MRHPKPKHQVPRAFRRIRRSWRKKDVIIVFKFPRFERYWYLILLEPSNQDARNTSVGCNKTGWLVTLQTQREAPESPLAGALS